MLLRRVRNTTSNRLANSHNEQMLRWRLPTVETAVPGSMPDNTSKADVEIRAFAMILV